MNSTGWRFPLFLIFLFLTCSISYAQYQLDITFPTEGHQFTAKDIFTVYWTQVDTPDGAERITTIKVVPVEEGQTPEEAFAENTPIIDFVEIPTPINYDRARQFDDVTLPKDKVLAVQVTAEFTGTGETAISQIVTFYSPKSVASFYAGIHTVAVDKILNSDKQNFAGRGRVRLKAEVNAWTNIEFDSLQLAFNGVFHTLSGGEIIIDTAGVSIGLIPTDENLGARTFGVSKYRIDKSGIYVYGATDMPAPLNTSWNYFGEAITTDSIWANFNNFVINDGIPIADGRELIFDATSAFKFVTSNSTIYVYENNFTTSLNGNIVVPLEGTEESFALTLTDVQKFDTVSMTGMLGMKAPLTRNAGLHLDVRNVHVDVSADFSQGDHQEVPVWTGMVFREFNLVFDTKLDTVVNHFILSNTATTLMSPEWTSDITSGGWNVKLSYPQAVNSGYGTMQIYYAEIDSVAIEKTNLEFTDSHLYGKITVPTISEAPLRFRIPVTADGFDTCQVFVPEVDEYRKLTPPFISIPADTSVTGFQITWLPDSMAVSYRISISDDAFQSVLENFDQLDAGTDTLFVAEGLESKTKYWYMVHTVREDGTVTNSLPGTVVTHTPPPVITGIAPESPGGEIHVRPNPFTSTIELVHRAGRNDHTFAASVYTVTGQMIFSSEHSTIHDINVNLNKSLASVQPGLYILQLRGRDGGVTCVRMMKK